MNRYYLWLWEESGDMFIYNLGEYEDIRGATFDAHSVMAAYHGEFVRSDNPCWQVHKAGEIVVREAGNIEPSLNKEILGG